MECNNCKHFKDKFKWVELPCSVGDTVYADKGKLNAWQTYLETKPYVLCKVIGIKFVGTKKLLNLRPLTERNFQSRYHEFFGFNAIGKSVFLSVEEAESALKEINDKQEQS